MKKPTIELAEVELMIENEISNGCNQRQIAQTYALALRSSWPTDWRAVNRMIMDRWSAAGLNRIKTMAHSGKCFDEKTNDRRDSRILYRA